MKTKIAIITALTLLTPLQAFAQEKTATALGEVSTFGELVSLMWAYGSNVLTALAIFFIVLGAFYTIASAGNEERISQGKQMIFGSVASLIIVLLSGVLIQILHKPAEGTKGVLSEVPDVIGRTTNILVGAIGAFTVLMLIYAGLLYVTAHGNEDRIEKAQRAIRYAFIGLVLGVLAFTITNTVIRFFL